MYPSRHARRIFDDAWLLICQNDLSTAVGVATPPVMDAREPAHREPRPSRRRTPRVDRTQAPHRTGPCSSRRARCSSESRSAGSDGPPRARSDEPSAPPSRASGADHRADRAPRPSAHPRAGGARSWSSSAQTGSMGTPRTPAHDRSRRHGANSRRRDAASAADRGALEDRVSDARKVVPLRPNTSRPQSQPRCRR
jgi:hypothetical protein